MSYTGTFLGLGEHKGYRCVLMKLDRIYFIPVEWVTSIYPREQEIPD